MKNKTEEVSDALQHEVFEEHFGIPFVTMLEKFVEENDDITQIAAIKQAKKLLKIINEG